MAVKDRYTKAQILNFLRTGDVDGTGPITDVPAAVERCIDYGIANNPTAAYAWLKKTYGNDAFMTIVQGTEFQEETQDSMSRVIMSKMAALSNDDKLAAAYAFFKALPKNTTIDNWTVPTN